jgi:hypothetical protein
VREDAAQPVAHAAVVGGAAYPIRHVDPFLAAAGGPFDEGTHELGVRTTAEIVERLTAAAAVASDGAVRHDEAPGAARTRQNHARSTPEPTTEALRRC